MKVINDQIVNAVSMSASIVSDICLLDSICAFAVQAVWTGAPSGTLKLQASNDFANPANWSDLPNAQSLSGSAGNYLWNDATTGYRWVRAVYSFSSGSGILNVRLNAKGI